MEFREHALLFHWYSYMIGVRFEHPPILLIILILLYDTGETYFWCVNTVGLYKLQWEGTDGVVAGRPEDVEGRVCCDRIQWLRLKIYRYSPPGASSVCQLKVSLIQVCLEQVRSVNSKSHSSLSGTSPIFQLKVSLESL
jgi:hypothetical protein